MYVDALELKKNEFFCGIFVLLFFRVWMTTGKENLEKIQFFENSKTLFLEFGEKSWI